MQLTDVKEKQVRIRLQLKRSFEVKEFWWDKV